MIVEEDSEMAVSFDAEIKVLFRNRDQNCMASPNFRMDLRNYAFMSDPAGNDEFSDHANARRVHKALLPEADPRMPLDGAFWSDEQIGLFEKWMDDGFAP
jgi:hypothetical protein